MVDAVATQTLIDGDKKVVQKFTNISDGTGESAVVKVDVSGLATNSRGVHERFWWRPGTMRSISVMASWWRFLPRDSSPSPPPSTFPASGPSRVIPTGTRSPIWTSAFRRRMACNEGRVVYQAVCGTVAARFQRRRTHPRPDGAFIGKYAMVVHTCTCIISEGCSAYC